MQVVPRCLQNKLHFKTFKYFFLLSSLLKCNLYICRICRNLPNYIFIIICRFITDRTEPATKTQSISKNVTSLRKHKNVKLCCNFVIFVIFQFVAAKTRRNRYLMPWFQFFSFQFSIYKHKLALHELLSS